MAPPVRVFLCYRRSDTSGYAGHLYSDLTSAFGERSVFMDIDTIAAGSDFVQEIDTALDSCDVVLVLIGRGWLEAVDERGRRRLDDPNDFVRLEIERALQRQMRVVPLLVGGATLPDVADLPESLTPLLRRHSIDLSDRRWAFDVRDLISTLRQRPGPALGQVPRRMVRDRQRPTALLVAASGALLLLLTLVLVLVLVPRGARGSGSPAATPSPPFTAATATSLLLTASDLPSEPGFPQSTVVTTTSASYGQYTIFDGDHAVCSGASVPILGMDATASASFDNTPPAPPGAQSQGYVLGNVIAHFTGGDAAAFMDEVSHGAANCQAQVNPGPRPAGIDQSVRWTTDTSCPQCSPPIPSGVDVLWLRHGSIVAAIYVTWSGHTVMTSFANALADVEARKLTGK